MAHATGHVTRLNRRFGAYGSAEYAEEELIAELASAFLCAETGIKKEGMTRNHAAYLSHWYERLGEDPEVFISSVAQAWKILEWIRAIPQPED